MREVFMGLLSPMLYMFFFIAAGFVLRRLKVLPDNAALVLSRLESYLIIPAVVINSFSHYCTVESVRDNAASILLCVGMLFVTVFLAAPISGLIEKDPYYRNVYRYSLIFPSWGFMGYALVQALFGGEILYYFILFSLPMSIGCYLYGIALLTPHKEGKAALWKNLLNPQMVAVVIGAVLGLLGVGQNMPSFLSDVLKGLSGMFSPMAMLLTGITIGSYSLKDMFRDRRTYLVCLFRMLLFPLILLVLARLIGLDDRLMVFVLFVHAMPLGLYPVIYPPQFGKDARPGASMALISCLVCLVTVPLFYAFLLKLLGHAPVL